MKYTFFDRDIYSRNSPDFDIDGEELVNLFLVCEKYCSYFSVCIYNQDTVGSHELEKYRIGIPKAREPEMKYEYPENAAISPNAPMFRRFYKMCPETKEILLSISYGIFGFMYDFYGKHNPEDPIFYRPDDSIFFSSLIHEGECSVYPRENEDISLLLKNPHWIEETYRPAITYTKSIE